MASFDIVNYSLRPSKNIQRQIVFDGIRILKSELELANMVYVGLGSIWFTDFVMAHKSLDIRDMISIESKEIGYARAVFNKPYATVHVRHGHSSQVLAELYEDENIRNRPWVVWLDYDVHLDEVLIDDIRSVIENSPETRCFLLHSTAVTIAMAMPTKGHLGYVIYSAPWFRKNFQRAVQGKSHARHTSQPYD